MPDAATKRTAAGAKSFVVYYWQVVDYASATLDTTLLSYLSSDACASCQRGINGLKDDAKLGATLSGGEETVTDLKVALTAVDSVYLATVTYTLTSTTQIESFPNGKTKQYPAASAKDRMTLQWLNNRWHVVQLEAEQ